jgi:hypothetical protein
MTKRIGSRTLARQIVEAFDNHDRTHGETCIDAWGSPGCYRVECQEWCPEGWETIGFGGERIAVLHRESATIYKFSHSDEEWSDLDGKTQSEWEVKFSRALRGRHISARGNVWIIPRISAYRVSGRLVSAMEYFPGTIDSTDLDLVLRLDNAELNRSGWWDIFYGNVRHSDQGIVIIDLGCFESAKPLTTFERV